MIHFEVAFPTLADAEVVRKWRNDPATIEMSFTHLEALSLEEFFPKYIQNYFSFPSLPPLFALYNGERVGILRFDPANSAGFCEISLVVAPEKRNRGLGTEMLKAVDPFLKRQGVRGVIAQIKKHNPSSLKAFGKAGFQVIEEGEVCRLEKKFIHEQTKVFIIAEAGSNWYSEGDSNGIKRGFQLIEAAKEAGADAVKFQTFKAKDTYVPNPGSADYLKDTGKGIEKLFEDLEMSEEMLLQLVEHCKKVGIEFMSSVFSPRDFALIDPHVSRHKIASYEISYAGLIELVAKSNKPLILSTGASNIADIDWAVSYFKKQGGKDLTLLQCTAKYPAEPETLNLNVIPWLMSRYQVQAGLSDHSLNPLEAPLAAVTLGATVIEKHFTLDRTLKGPDHVFAIEPKELKNLVSSIRAVEKMKGSSYKSIQPSEEELYFFCRRGIQALQDIQPGEILKFGANYAVLRPGKRSLGLHPKHLSEIEGKRVKQAIGKGEGIQFNFLEKT